MNVAVVFPGHVAAIEELGIQPAISPIIDRYFFRSAEGTAPPIFARVWEATGLDLVPYPVFPEGSAELIDEHLLQSLEEILRDLEDATELGACAAGIEHDGGGREADASGDLAHDGLYEWLEGGAWVFVFETLNGLAGLELGDEGAVVEGVDSEVLRGVVGCGAGAESAAKSDGFVAGDGEGDLGSGFGAAFFVGQIL